MREKKKRVHSNGQRKGSTTTTVTTTVTTTNTVQSQSSEVAYLHSENRFLYDGSLFFSFFLIPFFILKFEGGKKKGL